MEDPKRLRTKLRLDLNDVARQISDLEALLDKDKSPENVEAHAKLIDYEKKLKQQYEQMTGITLDEAESLTSTGPTITLYQSQKSSKLVGLVAGLLFTWAIYNMILQSITGFAPNDFFDFYLNDISGEPTNAISGGFGALATQLSNDDNQLYIVAPLFISIVLMIFSSFLTRNDSKLLSFTESLGIGVFVLYLLWAIALPDSVLRVTARFEDNIIIFGITFFTAGFLSLIGAFGKKKTLAKLASILTGVMFLWGSFQVLLVSIDTGSQINKLLFTWPWFMLASLLAGVMYTISNLFK